MDPKTFEDARTTWRVTFAHHTFRSVRAGIQAMPERAMTTESPEYYPFIVGLVCLYGSPFQKQQAGRET
jgi:hypothetical protein